MEKLIISADSHVFEPGDLWLKTLGGRFGERVPHAVDNFEGYEGRFFYVGRPGEAARMDELVDADAKDRRLEDLAQAGSDPAYRLKLMAKDNIAAEVLNPTWGLWIPRIADPAMRNACAEVYNDWIQEYCSQDLKRLLAIAMIPIADVDWAVKELARVVKRGARGIMVGTSPVDGAEPYRDSLYDPFWAAAGGGPAGDAAHRHRQGARPVHVPRRRRSARTCRRASSSCSRKRRRCSPTSSSSAGSSIASRT